MIKKLMETLNDEELRIVKEGNEKNREKLSQMTPEQIVQEITFGLLWDYKNKIEYEQDPEKRRALEKRKKELNTKWTKLGIIE